MSNTATRLITLILLLQRQPNQKAAELAEKLGVSVRSLHRYITMLDEMGIPIYSERGPHGGFSLVRGYQMPPLIFTPEEAAAVCLGAGLAREMWGHLYEEAAQGALAKIENVLPDDQRDEVTWARQALVTTGLYHPGLANLTPLLQTLRRAIRQQKQIRLRYQGANQTEPLERLMHPYALAHSRGWWYVVGHCALRNAVRSFRLDRIRAVEMLTDGFERPAGFDARHYLNEEQAQAAAVLVRLRFAPEAAHLARNNRYVWATLEERPDGAVVTTLALPDMLWAASLTMSYGPAVVVEAPEELRRMVREWAETVAKLY